MNLTRRAFFATPGALALPIPAAAEPPIDHRFAPARWQTAICFPDDPYKTLVGNRGELLYGHNGGAFDRFALVVEFGLAGDNAVNRSQSGHGIVATTIESGTAGEKLTAFATNRPGEGRVDNVLFEVTPEAGAAPFRAVPVMTVRTRQEVASTRRDNLTVITAGPGKRVLCVANLSLSERDAGNSWVFTGPALPTSRQRGMRCLFRFPQEGQTAESLAAGLRRP